MKKQMKPCLSFLWICIFAASSLFPGCGGSGSDSSPLAGKSVEELRKSLKDPDSTVRSQAAMALAGKGAEAKDAVPDLIRILGDAPTVRNKVVEALSKIGSPAVPSLIEALNDSNKQIRFYAAHSLKKIPSSKKAQDAYKEYMDREGNKLMKGAS